MKRPGAFSAALAAAVLVGCGVLCDVAAAEEPGPLPSSPVVVGTDPDLDACMSVGVVRGLDPAGDGFLAVRGGPDAKNRELDRLHNGEQVFICREAGNWLGIVYTRSNRDCNVTTPWPRAQPYTGPCRSGWVHKRWIEWIAG